MKLKPKISIFLVTVAALGILFTPMFSAGQAQKGKSVFALSEEVETGKVLGIHTLSLKAGVEPGQFEKFVVEEWTPLVQDMFPGIKIMIMKGERGSRVNQYILAYDISSLYVRNFYFPKASENSELAQKIINDKGEKLTKLWDRFQQMAEIPEWTDFVALAKR